MTEPGTSCCAVVTIWLPIGAASWAPPTCSMTMDRDWPVCTAPYSTATEEGPVCMCGKLTVVTTGASSETSSSVTMRDTSTSWLGTANSRTAVTCALYSPASTASPTPVTTSSLSTKRSYWKPVCMIRCCTLPEAFWVTTSWCMTFGTSTAVSWISVFGTCTTFSMTLVSTILGMCFCTSWICGTGTCLMTSATWTCGTSLSRSS
mmetsp:Transcript_74192/g.221393  ORF Transcript_74192/g.221393 Transcript_74192/m.221393 type:complete len:205 (-) Transcript_74192:1309-1923(-)